jgi:hypothetical protein
MILKIACRPRYALTDQSCSAKRLSAGLLIATNWRRRPKQFGCLNLQNMGKPANNVYPSTIDASLQRTDIAAIDFCTVGNFFLRQPP